MLNILSFNSFELLGSWLKLTQSSESEQVITDEMKNFLEELQKKVVIAVVGGSDLCKIKEQMGGDACNKSFFTPIFFPVRIKILAILVSCNVHFDYFYSVNLCTGHRPMLDFLCALDPKLVILWTKFPLFESMITPTP